ncbi:hypothetical protein GF362_00005, partial [Candidatus Dojkabacteria bacterium]|nr:hypothetical protein [Candidatus Dojkabacteria bacterium]
MEKEHKIYPFLRTFYWAGIIILLCDVILTLIFIFLFVYNPIEIQYMALIALLLSPFWFFGIYLLLNFNGRLILTKDAITLEKKFFPTQSIKFKNIKKVDYLKTGFPPLIVVKSKQKEIKINRMIYRLQEAIQIIKAQTNYKITDIQLPYTLQYSQKTIITNIILFVILIVFWGILTFFAYRESPQALPVLLFMSFIIIFITAAAVVFTLLKDPIKITSSKTHLKIIYLLGKKVSLRWEDIISISVKPIYIKSSRYNIGHYSYPVEITH